jgi:anoctamin-10
MQPQVDLVITFRASSKSSSKQQIQKEVLKAETQYSRLVQTLSNAGLKAVGRRGESLGHLLVFVKCPDPLLAELVKRER